MRIVYLLIFLFGCKGAFAHTPDLASLMIYEQNGKTILLVNSSLTAFEGEVEYHYGKDAYKTPEEFNQLVVSYFKENCFVVANSDTVKFSNVQVQLGHETNLFAELDNVPKSLTSLYVKNALFKDLYSNKCELIMTLNGLPQKQFILNNGNGHEVSLTIENKEWMAVAAEKSTSSNRMLLFGVAAIFLFGTMAFIVLKRLPFRIQCKKKESLRFVE